ncbi:MAG: 50S ribosomal protein L23 [Candidatus Omnitrophota bacterium]|nr:MAG: 50S ribosomal protein L23 [Candidatus Omnitrophota bacterium]
MRSIYSIIKAPLITEKASRIMADRKYVFWVDREANKVDVKRAVEKIYNVKVEKISSMVVKSKSKRIRWNQPGKTTSWKKAVVTLKSGFEIKLT